jgi:TIR domain/Carboxypeptidase regulatory-like domain
MDDQYQPRVICVFVSAVLSDMQPDRDYLNKFTFPRLRELCASRGVSLKIVDLPRDIISEDTVLEDVLQLTLEELQRSHPYYIGLIGQDYGRMVERIPNQLLGRWPSLAQYQGRSINELEIVFGVLRDEAMYGRGFFYFRDPKSVDARAQEVRKSVESSDNAWKLDDLKQSIRDVSQQRICRLHENYRSAEELGEWVLEDFRQLIDKLWPVRKGQTKVRPYDDDVMFTVYRPRTVVSQKWYSLLAFAHLSERRADAPADEADPLDEVQRQAQQILGDKVDEYRESSQDSRELVPHAGEITFTPFIPGFDFNPSSRSFRWEESVHHEEFKMRATTAPIGEVIKGLLTVYLGPLILAEINLSIRVNKSVSPETRQALAWESARPLGKVFASYSHKDLAIVERIEEMVSQTYLGIEYLRDVKKLRSGEVWSPRLMEMISEANAFQLFWSTNSMRSDFVRQEYQYALALRRKGFIRPVFWETPFPENPEDGLPPDELRRLHFAKLAQSIANFSRSPAREKPPTAREYGQRISEVATEAKDYVSDKVSVVGDKCKDLQNGDLGEVAENVVTSASRVACFDGHTSAEMEDLESLDSYSKCPSSKRFNIKPLLVALISATTILMLGTLALFRRSNLDRSATVATSSNSSSDANRLSATGGLVGSVSDLSGRPIPDTTVSIVNGPQARTDANGHFVLEDVPPGIHLIELSSPSSKRAVQSVSVESNETSSVSLIYDPPTSRIGLLSITDPVNGAKLKVDRVGSQIQGVVYGRCDGVAEVFGPFAVWVLIHPEDDSGFWVQQPQAVIDPESNTWQVNVAFGDTQHPWSNGRRWHIVAIAAPSKSHIEQILTTPTSKLLPPHVTSNVVTITATDR